MQKIEYRVRPITRYIVTRYDETLDGHAVATAGSSSQHGEFENFETAYQVGYALCKAEHDRLGWPLDDERIRYPDDEPTMATLYRKMADSLRADEAKSKYGPRKAKAYLT